MESRKIELSFNLKVHNAFEIKMNWHGNELQKDKHCYPLEYYLGRGWNCNQNDFCN